MQNFLIAFYCFSVRTLRRPFKKEENVSSMFICRFQKLKNDDKLECTLPPAKSELYSIPLHSPWQSPSSTITNVKPTKGSFKKYVRLKLPIFVPLLLPVCFWLFPSWFLASSPNSYRIISDAFSNASLPPHKKNKRLKTRKHCCNY